MTNNCIQLRNIVFGLTIACVFVQYAYADTNAVEKGNSIFFEIGGSGLGLSINSGVQLKGYSPYLEVLFRLYSIV